ncbi:MAG TPA: heterodisulfide reductase-related iron-sulfur binding cluster [Candidatus Limnocylindria bacterium]
MRSEDLATCISCGLCLNDCPTYRILGDEADSPRGRIQLIRTLVAADAAPSDQVTEHIEACLVCRACETACPSGVPFGRIMEGAREVLHERRREGRITAALRRFGLATVASAPRLGLATRLADAYARSPLSSLVRRIGPRALAWASSLAPRREGPPYRPVERAGADACLFAGCIMRESFGDTERATVRVLERGGRIVSAPAEQTCCGALHAHAGDGETARELARLNIDAFSGTAAPIVVNAAGCGAHLKAYGDLLADDAAWGDRASAFARRVRDASEAATVSGLATKRPLRVVYQDACHLAHGQKIRTQPRALLRAVSGVTLVEIADAERCCGSAGIYNITHPAISAELQRQKVRSVLAASPDVVVSANPGCMLQLQAGLRAAGSDVPVVHLMRFLDDPQAFG